MPPAPEWRSGPNAWHGLSHAAFRGVNDARPGDRSAARACYDTAVETFTAAERAALAPFFTDLDGPVFALVNLPEVVKGALFARYSRSPKSLRRLFLDEFLDSGHIGAATVAQASGAGTARAERLYDRVFV